ncbi:MAG TPA: DUF4012 domain-containing protein, partial [Ktedonobacterales bacterium]
RQTVLILTLVILSVLATINAGVGSLLWASHAATVSKVATARLEAHLATIEALVARPDPLQPATLAQLQHELTATSDALEQVRSVLPFGGAIGTGDNMAEGRALQLALRVTEALQGGITAFLAVRPAMIALTSSVFQGARATPPPDGKPLTMNDVHAAQVALFDALVAWRQAVALRATLSAHDLALIAAPSFQSLMHRFDQLAPTLTYALNTMSALVDWAPASFGLLAPERFLLVEMDPTVLRPTGGAFARYAVLTTERGMLTSGVQLQSVAALDCPRADCPASGLPPAAKWFPLDAFSARLQDVNVNPDLADSGRQIEAVFQRKAATQVDGVILITPALFAHLLAAIGPVSLPQLRETLTAETVEERLSAYHARQAAQARAPGAAWAASDLDALLVQAITARLATLSAPQRDAVGRAVLRALATKDIQLFSNSPRVEEALTTRGLAGQVQAPAGDSLEIVDTNVSGAPITPAIAETATDAVTLDSKGGAAHQLTLTYRSDVPQGGPAYTDVVRVLVPQTATNRAIQGPCAPLRASQAGHAVLACQFTLPRGAAVTLQFSWYVPGAVAASDANQARATAYALLLQRQPGARLSLAARVSAPPDRSFASAAAPGKLANGQVTFSAAPLLSDVALRARFAP